MSLHETDYAAWLAQQAGVLRRLRETDVNLPLDLDLLAEELDDMRLDLEARVASYLVTILQHLLELQYSPAERPRSGWQNTVDRSRGNARRRITPVIEASMRAQLEALYGEARTLAERDLRRHHENAAADALPPACPYTLEQALDPAWWPAR